MSNACFLSADVSRTATITGSTTVAGMDYTMLADPQPRHRARINATVAQIILDLLTVQSVDVAALLSTSLLSTSTARLRMSDTDPTVVASLLYDSGVLATVTHGRYNGNVIMPLSAPVSVRYLRWDLVQAASPIDIGLAPCGLMFRPQRNFSYGSQEGRFDPSLRDGNPDTGAEFSVARPVKRMRTFSLDGLTQSEDRSALEDMDRLIGVAGDLLFIEDIDATAVARAQSAIWGGFRKAPDSLSTRRFTNTYSRPITMLERL